MPFLFRGAAAAPRSVLPRSETRGAANRGGRHMPERLPGPSGLGIRSAVPQAPATSASVVLQVLGDACMQRGPFLDYATSAVDLLVTAIAQVLGRLEPPV